MASPALLLRVLCPGFLGLLALAPPCPGAAVGAPCGGQGRGEQVQGEQVQGEQVQGEQVPGEQVPGDLQQALAWLEDDQADRRRAGERWLGENLVGADLAAVARAALDGGPESLERLTTALGGDDRHLELAALLAADDNPRLADLGRAAIGERIAAWSSSLDDPALPRRRLPTEWEEASARPMRMDPRSAELATLVERLQRLGRGPAPLVLDPVLDPAVRQEQPGPDPRARRVEGGWIETLDGLVRARRVTFEVIGHRSEWARGEEEEAPEPRAWVRIAPRGELGTGTTRQLLVGWCVEVAREGADLDLRAAHARALAQTDWPGGLGWLETRWRDRGDRAALAGLLLAAGRGRVVPGLLQPGSIRGLLGDLDREEQAARPLTGSLEEQRLRQRAQSLALALAATGPTGSGGQRLLPALLEGWEQAGPLGRWVRLVALEGHGQVDPAAEPVVRGVVESARAPIALQLQALRVLALLPELAAVPVGDRAASWLGVAAGRDQGEELARVLVAARGLELGQEAWWEEVGASLGREETRILLRWALARGHGGAAAFALRGLLARGGDPAPLRSILIRWLAEDRGALVEQLLTELAADPDPGIGRRALRLALAVGQRSPAEARQDLDALLGREAELSAADLLDLGVLAAHPQLGWRARAALVTALEATGLDPDALREACTDASRLLLRDREDALEEAFRDRVASTAVRLDHVLAPVFWDPAWPPRPAPEPRSLAAEDRWLGPGEP